MNKEYSPLLKRFLRYVQIDTQSDENSTSYPSTVGQTAFMHQLADELREMGVSGVEIDRWGYLTAQIPATDNNPHTPTIAFIAHIDTSPDVSGRGVKPQVVEYAQGDIAINENLVLASGRMADHKGHRIVTSDGTTLLGADDKAGVAIVVTLAETLLNSPDSKHGEIRLLFTPDEEIGLGVEHFSAADLGADYAYTVDGGALGALEWECFNAASAKITVRGRSAHPGYAKGAMVNSQHLAMELAAMFPAGERPEHTEGREGFFHLASLAGSTEESVLSYIIRDHDRQAFEKRKQLVEDIARQANKLYARYGMGDLVSINIRDQYRNMGEVIGQHFEVVEVALEAMREMGIEPVVEAIRGGTDGSRLSFMGLPCPNIFTGAENIHSRLEFVSEDVMRSSMDVCLKIIDIFSVKNLRK